MQNRNAAVYPRLLARLQRRRARLTPDATLRLLALSARYGSSQVVHDILSLGADAAAPSAAHACLLAQAAMNRSDEDRENVMSVLLAAGAHMRVEDVVCCVVQQAAGALQRLLRMAAPRVRFAGPRPHSLPWPPGRGLSAGCCGLRLPPWPWVCCKCVCFQQAAGVLPQLAACVLLAAVTGCRACPDLPTCRQTQGCPK